ncbi:MAG: fructose-bisphosphate aldolase [archaeon]
MTIQINKILKKGKAIYLAYDQGMEHGPSDFNLKNVDPNYILDIALEGHYNGIVLQAGIAEKYYQDYYKDIPLIVKLNGQTMMTHGEPNSKQLCSVERAMKLGASAVGYTFYCGSEYEDEMMVEISNIVEKAHDYGIPVIVWVYPRGKYVSNKMDTNLIAYGVRVAAELGADIIKTKFNGDYEGFKWVIKNAGKTKVVLSGGDKVSPEAFIEETYNLMQIGATGRAVGRNIWQDEKPFSLTKALHAVVFDNKTVEEAKKFLK